MQFNLYDKEISPGYTWLIYFWYVFSNLHGQTLEHRKYTENFKSNQIQVKLGRLAQIKVLQGQLPKYYAATIKSDLIHQIVLTFPVGWAFFPSATYSFLNVQTLPDQEKVQHHLLWLLFQNGKYSTELAKTKLQLVIKYFGSCATEKFTQFLSITSTIRNV